MHILDVVFKTTCKHNNLEVRIMQNTGTIKSTINLNKTIVKDQQGNKFHIKEPGSAITHFIGMVMAIFAAIPLLIRAAYEPDRIYIVSMTIYAASLILLYAASTTYHTFDISEKVNTILKKIDHMMISVLIAGSYTPVCLIVLKGRLGIILLSIVWAIAIAGILIILGILSEMGVICTVYRNGMDLCTCIYPAAEQPVTRSVRMAAGRRHHLYGGRCHLRAEAPALQQPA